VDIVVISVAMELRQGSLPAAEFIASLALWRSIEGDEERDRDSDWHHAHRAIDRRPGSGARALAGSSHDAQGRDHQPVRVRRDEDAGGRSRLTFFHKSRRFRLIVDGTGTVLQRSIAEDRARTDS
jgi:Family of unknown function (DUF6522)